MVQISDSSCGVLQILGGVLFYNMIAIGKLLDPKFLIKALKIKLNGAIGYKDFVCLSENTTTSSVTWSVTVVA